ncbi:hypothetical protein ACMAUO_07100 [Gluconacetobacter sp. Hr-1-5]|uniref:hypothetical protein n=1 Tax=Gluconacetobacter sp. Hr-1-5 TaxID=3395370 RepID=UPI003B51C797
MPNAGGLAKDQGERSVSAGHVLDRQVTADRPNWGWVADFSNIWFVEGWFYVAVIIDLFSCRIVGCLMSSSTIPTRVANAPTRQLARGYRQLQPMIEIISPTVYFLYQYFLSKVSTQSDWGILYDDD